MKDLLSLIKDIASALVLITGVALAFIIFWHFVEEYQNRQHTHEKEMQALQIDHERSIAADTNLNESRATKRNLVGVVIEKAVDIGQKFFGL